MDYKTAKYRKDTLNYLSGQSLLISTDWTIKDVIVLPREDGTRLVYSGHIKMYAPEWMATGFDHDFIYQKSGLYITADGRQWDDDLTLFVLTKQIKDNMQTTYRCHYILNLVNAGEIKIVDVEGL